VTLAALAGVSLILTGYAIVIVEVSRSNMRSIDRAEAAQISGSAASCCKLFSVIAGFGETHGPQARLKAPQTSREPSYGVPRKWRVPPKRWHSSASPTSTTGSVAEEEGFWDNLLAWVEFQYVSRNESVQYMTCASSWTQTIARRSNVHWIASSV
jgi:hypothetical protein